MHTIVNQQMTKYFS